jgi:hypothetical protein
MAKLTAYDINSSTQVARTHSGVSDSENNGEFNCLSRDTSMAWSLLNEHSASSNYWQDIIY